MASHENLLADALDLDRGRMSHYCRTVDPRFLDQLNRKKPRTMAQLADVWYGSQGENYDEPSEYGIDEGRISKLMLKRNGEIVYNYDRGLDVEPIDEDTEYALAILLKEYS